MIKSIKKRLTLLKAKITMHEAGDDRQGEREVEVDYYIGLTYEALHNRSKANASFRSSAQQPSQTVNATTYYQGLSYAKLGNNNQAKKIFKSMVSEANQQMEQSVDSEVGAIFGRHESADNRLSRLYTMQGLGLSY